MEVAGTVYMVSIRSRAVELVSAQRSDMEMHNVFGHATSCGLHGDSPVGYRRCLRLLFTIRATAL
jgi:hypothetical protein